MQRISTNSATVNTQITSVNNVLVVKFKATKMLPTQDFRDFSLQGSFRFVKTHCHDETAVTRGGFVTLDYHSSEQAICDKKSWSIRPKRKSYSFILAWGSDATK